MPRPEVKQSEITLDSRRTPPAGGHQPQLLATESEIAVSGIKIPKQDAFTPISQTHASPFLRGACASLHFAVPPLCGVAIRRTQPGSSPQRPPSVCWKVGGQSPTLRWDPVS